MLVTAFDALEARGRGVVASRVNKQPVDVAWALGCNVAGGNPALHKVNGLSTGQAEDDSLGFMNERLLSEGGADADGNDWHGPFALCSVPSLDEGVIVIVCLADRHVWATRWTAAALLGEGGWQGQGCLVLSSILAMGLLTVLRLKLLFWRLIAALEPLIERGRLGHFSVGRSLNRLGHPICQCIFSLDGGSRRYKKGDEWVWEMHKYFVQIRRVEVGVGLDCSVGGLCAQTTVLCQLTEYSVVPSY